MMDGVSVGVSTKRLSNLFLRSALSPTFAPPSLKGTKTDPERMDRVDETVNETVNEAVDDAVAQTSGAGVGDDAGFGGGAGGSVTDAYQKNHDEIQRRQKLTQSDDVNPRTFERVAGAPEPPFKNDAQTHFVWSASHDGMAPRAKDAQHPALRIYGLFSCYEEALEHARVVASVDASCSLMISPTHEWTMLPRAPDRLGNAPDHVRKVLAAYGESRDASKKEFTENVESRRGGVGVKGSAPGEEGGGGDEGGEGGDASSLPADAALAPRRLGRDAEVRDQSIVAISVVKDTTQEVGEPVFRVYGAFENTAEGDAWARVAGDTVVDYDIDLVSTCVWLFVNDVEAEKVGKEVYRSNELNSIMENQRKQPQLCENYKKWRDESESEA